MWRSAYAPHQGRRVNDVLIIEDHPFVAEATKEVIARAHPTLVTTVCCAAEPALQALRCASRSWHRILLDLDIPGAHGLSMAVEIEKLGWAPITCVVTATDRRDFILQTRNRGFLGYIVKSTPATEFSAGLAKVFDGERVFRLARATRAASAVRITRRQAEVLDLVRRGYSSKQIAAHLGVAEGTVNNHMNAIMGVLDATSRSHAVAKAIELGLIALAGGARKPG